MDNYQMIVYPVETMSGIQWNVEFPDVKGCGGAGDTEEEAINDAKTNLTAHLSFLKEEGMAIPVPTNPFDKSDYSGKILLRISKKLHKELSLMSERENMSINTIINSALSQYVGYENCYSKVEKLLKRIQEQKSTEIRESGESYSWFRSSWPRETANNIICTGGIE